MHDQIVVFWPGDYDFDRRILIFYTSPFGAEYLGYCYGELKLAYLIREYELEYNPEFETKVVTRDMLD